MYNNARNQRNARKNTQKQNFFDEIMSIKPRDYQERNWFYDTLARVVSYPLQLASIVAGTYLVYEGVCKLMVLSPYSTGAMVVFMVCALFYFGIEALRRSLVYEVGYHYFATYTYETSGEWLRTKLIVLAFISLFLVVSGTYGAYQYSQNNAPQQATLDIKEATSPLLMSIQGEKNQIAQIDKSIANLQNSKAVELRDHKSYAVWEGKEYLLPETKTRHEGYDKQIATYQAQRQKHLDFLAKHEAKLDKTEEKTNTKNAQIAEQNILQKNSYSIICAIVWLVFETLLLYCVAYEWIYMVGAKSYKFDEQDAKALQQPSQEASQTLQQPLQQPLQEVLQQPLQEAVQQALQDLFPDLAKGNKTSVAKKQSTKQEKLPDLEGLIKALKEGDTRTNFLSNAYNVNFTHINSAKALLGLHIKEPEKLINTSEYIAVVKHLNIPIKNNTALFPYGDGL